MEVNVNVTAKSGNIAQAGGPAVAVNMYSGVKEPAGATKAVDQTIGGMISRAIRSGDFKGELEEVHVLYPAVSGRNTPERVILLGLGKKENFNAESARRVGGVLVNTLRKLKVKSAATVVHGGDGAKNLGDLARGLTEGILMGAYRYDNHFRDGRNGNFPLETVTIVEKDSAKLRSIQAGVALGASVAESVNEARELGNTPSNICTPTHIAKTAQRLGKENGFSVRVMDRGECEKLGMGAFLGVAKGSDEPCKFIVMEYNGRSPKGTVCLVGKGITFDTGGISIKPADQMDQMKFDMCGAAAVIASLRFAAERKLPLKVIGLVPATENMPGGHAYKPGDILESSAGVTIEVLNTDAEGRLILCDALAYAARYKPDAVVDIATLTGAVIIGLGHHAAGVMGNDEWMLDQLTEAGYRSGERLWALPLWLEYREQVKSEVADIKNTAGRPGGSITAGAFLGAFTNGYRWAHLDIAGTMNVERARAYQPLGATGAAVRVLTEFLNNWKPPKGKGPQPGRRTSLGPVRETPAAKEARKPQREPAKIKRGRR
jgi:leucyl aminopeptidase